MVLYRGLRLFLRFALHVFFRQVSVVGREHLPPEGTPVLFAGNHPNSLLDPVLILATAGRVVRFAAKDVLFRNAFARFFLRSLGAVPVQRRADHGEGADNRAAFDALSGVLAAGGAMGIFPEGLSHDRAQLAELKTGAARIALEVAGRGAPVQIIPCGLTYMRPKRFRSRVLVQYGPPIVVAAPAPGSDEREAARDLTAQIAEALRGLTVNAPDWETLRVLDAVRRLYQPPRIPLAERVELARRFATVYARVREEPEVAALYQRVAAWLARIDAAGLDERDLARPPGPLGLALRGLRNAVLLLVWLPLAAPGFVIHAPLVWGIRVAAVRFTPRKDATATTKLVLGVLLIPLSLLLLSALVALAFGVRWGLVAFALLGLSGYATVRVLERGLRLRRLAGTAARLLSLPREVRALREERAALEVEVVRAVDRFRPSDMQPLFSRSPPSSPSPLAAGDSGA